MVAERTGTTNALRHGIDLAAERTSSGPAEAFWDTLADLRTHMIWGGERAGAKSRLTSMEAPDGPVSVGTEFRSQGLDPMGRFDDRSVVTEAIRPTTFEFVTEARLITTKGRTADWTVVHRYDLTPSDEGCAVRYRVRVTRISELPGAMAVLNISVLSSLARRMMKAALGGSLERLTAYVEGQV